ncbi:LuxR C-terminal-related transcriptional regulator [Leucobacter chromiisoli]|uniref:LuxR C-terminal-related transcriptional regulator n=1 Tax=Leucobacter chromiisoli TaxID=2796471 RepID=UPI0027DC0FAD|nr:LuxR C-terminal-related transcriptional regulator [Leucobacter chromiisoli]
MQRSDRLTEPQLLDRAVADFGRATGFPVVFAGYGSHDVATITSLSGTRTSNLEGLEVRTGRGLGGRAIAERRPRLTSDYERSLHITHDYDRQVLSEGIVALVAFPVIVDGRTRAVLYGAARGRTAPAGALSGPACAIVDGLARELRVRDEVSRRTASLLAESAPSAIPAGALEELRESYAELRSIASGVADPELRGRLSAVERRLAQLGRAGSPEAREVREAPEVRLSPREVDVLSCAALGSTNARIGALLGLTESTVKSYLKTAMTKLEAPSRHAAVSAARRAGLIP